MKIYLYLLQVSKSLYSTCDKEEVRRGFGEENLRIDDIEKTVEMQRPQFKSRPFG